MSIQSETDIELNRLHNESIDQAVRKHARMERELRNDHPQLSFRDLVGVVMGMQIITAAIVWITIVIMRVGT